jgi:hypothetical protein
MILKSKYQNPVEICRFSLKTANPHKLQLISANSRRRSLKYSIGILLFCTLLFGSTLLYAQEITILYTGSTHGALYHCNCPIEPDGGVARRATLVKQIRKNNPAVLLLDSGSFFAGGQMDENTQNTQLDSQRTLINLKAMEIMRYDAASISADEFNFGTAFLQENISRRTINFLSANLKADNILPYMVKELSGVKVGIIGVTGSLAKEKISGLELLSPNDALAEAITRLKEEGAKIIIVLSSLGQIENSALINEVKDIDLLISSGLRKEDNGKKLNNILVLKPSWQGRRMDKLTLSLKDNKIADYKLEELRLSDNISDDPEIAEVLPSCFLDAHCKKEGSLGLCQNAGTLNARCLFSQAATVRLWVITVRDCRVCDVDRVVGFLKQQVPGLNVSYLYYPQKKAKDLLGGLGIVGLPAYLLGKEVEKEKSFGNLKPSLDQKEDFYIVKPQASGISYFTNRQEQKGALDLFLSLYDKESARLLDEIREFKPKVHFLASRLQDEFQARYGNLEVEEYLRASCIEKYYPQAFWDYLSCRAKNINSSWWQDCAADLDSAKIISCAKSQEGKELLGENIAMNKELQVMFGPTYLLDNQEVFGTEGTPTKEELKKIIKR